MKFLCNISIIFFSIINVVYSQTGSDNAGGVCGPGGRYTSCGSACPATCDFVRNKHTVCARVCRSGCICGPGYVLQSIKNPICIKKENCNKTKSKNQCDENEVYKQCGSACPRTCNDLRNKNRHKICTLQCVRGCFCKPNYYRSKNGTCVKQIQCFKD